ncbi:hypothetical protein CFE70_001399 [Pyrenophora teres f. teres 0-1]
MAIKAFAAIDAGDSKLSKWFYKNGYYVSAADLTSLGEGDNRRLFIDRTRLYVPNDARLRRRIFDLCHDHEIAGYKGPRATLYLMYERYYWPGMLQSIATYCKACAVSTVNWSTPSGTKKLNHRWAGPYTVTRTIHDRRAYELELPDAIVLAGVFPVFHPRLLRPANDEGLPDQAPPTPVEVQITDEKGDSYTEWLVDEFVDVRLGTKGRAKDR